MAVKLFAMKSPQLPEGRLLVSMIPTAKLDQALEEAILSKNNVEKKEATIVDSEIAQWKYRIDSNA